MKLKLYLILPTFDGTFEFETAEAAVEDAALLCPPAMELCLLVAAIFEPPFPLILLDTLLLATLELATEGFSDLPDNFLCLLSFP